LTVDRHESTHIEIRTRATIWFGVVVFAYYYKALFCGLIGHTLGFEAICFTWIRGISTNHWIEIIVYCPLLWLGLHMVNNDVFGNVPTRAEALRRHRRSYLVSEFAIALVLYGTGVHIANVIEIFSRERAGLEDGSVYDLVYFLDEGISHYLQFVPLFFVIGWWIINDRPGRTEHSWIALFFGVGHGIERAIGIIEGGKWFLGPPTVAWIALAALIRWKRVGSRARHEFFFRYAVAFCISIPIGQLAYYTRFGSFAQPSGLGEDRLTEVGLGGVVLTVAGVATLSLADRWWRDRGQNLPTKVPS
jgi:hypothetical protein